MRTTLALFSLLSIAFVGCEKKEEGRAMPGHEQNGGMKKPADEMHKDAKKY